MKINLEELLKASFEEEFEMDFSEEELVGIPEQHSQRTAECPPIGSYKRFAQEGWPAELKAHAISCIFCQKSLSWIWEIIDHHPSDAELLDPTYENRLAVDQHLNKHCCELCNNKIKVK